MDNLNICLLIIIKINHGTLPFRRTRNPSLLLIQPENDVVHQD
jgi:hypothetical protein